MDILDADISGLLSMSLSQQGSGTLGSLRAMLGEVIVDLLQISYEMAPTGKISEHRQAVHDLFIPIPLDAETGQATGPGAVLAIQRRFVLSSLFNGDLEDENAVTHHCAYACCSSYEETELRFRTLAPWALIPHKAPRYARSKWTNHSASVQWSGLISCHHQLLVKLMQRWVGGPAENPSAAAGNADVDAESAVFLEDRSQVDAPPPAVDEPEADVRMERDEEVVTRFGRSHLP